jgi:hypothetical protein
VVAPASPASEVRLAPSLRGGGPTRRTLLAASAAGIGGLALAGCGGQHKRRKHPVSGAGARDVELLNAALAIEQRSIAAYTAVGPLLTGVAQHAAGRFLGQELLHAGALRRLIKEVGGKAHDPLPHYDLGTPRGRSELLALLHGLEQQQIAAYLRAIPVVSTAHLRQALASILANDAQHVTVLRAEQGLTALTAPLVTSSQ